MNIPANEINTVGIILIPMLAEVISFPHWSEKKVMSNPSDMCHCYAGARDLFWGVFGGNLIN